MKQFLKHERRLKLRTSQSRGILHLTQTLTQCSETELFTGVKQAFGASPSSTHLKSELKLPHFPPEEQALMEIN